MLVYVQCELSSKDLVIPEETGANVKKINYI